LHAAGGQGRAGLCLAARRRTEGSASMNPWIGVGLALAGLILGGVLLGWQGVIFATTGIVFWLLLQISRLMRIMKTAGAAPLGSVANAVMLNSKLHAGMKLVDLISLAGSLGAKQAPE